MKTSKIKKIEGRAVPLRGNDIDTDRIIPARYLRCVTFEGLGAHAFEDDRLQDKKHPFDQPQFQGANILLAKANFGCGSSREHAPQALKDWGITGIVGESFAEIFFGNCTALGIPCLQAEHDDLEAIFQAVEKDPQLVVTLDLAKLTITAGDLKVKATMLDSAREALTTGTWNATMVLLEDTAAIELTVKRLPYVGNFTVAV